MSQFQIFIADVKDLDDCKAAAPLGKCEASMQRAYIIELEAAVADSFQKYASDKKKCDKAIEGAHKKCIQKGTHPSTAVFAFFGACKKALVDREESQTKKAKNAKLDCEFSHA